METTFNYTGEHVFSITIPFNFTLSSYFGFRDVFNNIEMLILPYQCMIEVYTKALRTADIWKHTTIPDEILHSDVFLQIIKDSNNVDAIMYHSNLYQINCLVEPRIKIVFALSQMIIEASPDAPVIFASTYRLLNMHVLKTIQSYKRNVVIYPSAFIAREVIQATSLEMLDILYECSPKSLIYFVNECYHACPMFAHMCAIRYPLEFRTRPLKPGRLIFNVSRHLMNCVFEGGELIAIRLTYAKRHRSYEFAKISAEPANYAKLASQTIFTSTIKKLPEDPLAIFCSLETIAMFKVLNVIMNRSSDLPIEIWMLIKFQLLRCAAIDF